MGRNRKRLEGVAQTCTTKGAFVVISECDMCDAKAMEETLLAEDDKSPVRHIFFSFRTD